MQKIQSNCLKLYNLKKNLNNSKFWLPWMCSFSIITQLKQKRLYYQYDIIK